jgi:signal peptidase I
MSASPMTTPAEKPAEKPKPKGSIMTTFREGVETVSFVVALVLMLKLFVVEAFVIPTGSMAETLYGYNKLVECPSCGFEFPVNSSEEVEPQMGMSKLVVGACCPNCRYRVRWQPQQSPSNRSGDRVLVHKATYHLEEPTRGDVVVFRYPVDPQANFVTNNYIKRLWGFGNETIGIYRGDVYVAKEIEYPITAKDSFGRIAYPRPEDPDRLWEGVGPSIYVSRTDPPYQMKGEDYSYHNAEVALTRFEQDQAAGFPGKGGFELMRKSNATAMEMRRPVYDNDKQSKYLATKGVPPRWSIDGSGFSADASTMPKVFKHTGSDYGTLRYLHRVSNSTPIDFNSPKPPEPPAADLATEGQIDDWRLIGQGYREGLFPPALITNVFGYNTGLVTSGFDSSVAQSRASNEFWVGDLMLEAKVTISALSDEVVFELSKGPNRFHAKFADGQLTLSRTGPGEKSFLTKPSPITKPGSYQVRFANVDCRLRVWINGSALDLGDAADYSPSDGFGYSEAAGAIISAAFAPWNPASCDAVTDALAYPAGMTLQNDLLSPASIRVKGNVEIAQIKLWQDTFFTPSEVSHRRFAKLDTFYVQPGHYLCLGDNSGHSSDSRAWGVVPKRLMLGKAIFVFFPFNRLGFIR